MNRKVAIFILITAVCLLTVFLKVPEGKTQTHTPPYLLKENDGVVSLYKQSVFQGNYDIPLNTLPEYDRNMLKKGIYLNSIEEVNQIIEDFDG